MNYFLWAQFLSAAIVQTKLLDFQMFLNMDIIKMHGDEVMVERNWKNIYMWVPTYSFKRKRKRSDSVLWQKPLHQQKCQKGKVTTQTTPQKSSIKQRLQTDLGRSVGVTKATQLVWLTGLRAHLPTNFNNKMFSKIS